MTPEAVAALQELCPGCAPASKAGLLLFLHCRARVWDWAKVALLLMLQKRCFPRMWSSLRRVWERLSTRRLQITTAEELQALRERLSQGRLSAELELAGRRSLPAGAAVLTSAEDLESAQLPVRLRWRRGPAARKGGGGRPMKRERVLRDAAGVLALTEVPFLFWAWSQMAGEGLTYLASQPWSMWDRKVVGAVLCKVGTVVHITAVAWFFHRLISWWRDKRSRGRAVVSDVLGWESSLKEAQVSALKVSMQGVVWALYTCAVLWVCGFQIGNVLLFPSVTAVLLGWIGREVVANVISGVVIHITQPFAQGDWVTLESGSIDGWVQDTGTFYTRVVQWDKRPVYVPNFKLMSMNVQNNSRMTHRRILFDLRLRLRDIPMIPTIVQDIQEMINEHEDIDAVQHRLVRWRGIGDFSADIWVSCYTQPTMEGIRLGTWTAVQQSVLERCSQIVYKHGAEFASMTDRFQYGQATEQEAPKTLERLVTDKLFDTFNSARESQLDSREQVLRQREREVKERERENEGESTLLAQKAKSITKAEEKYRQLLAATVSRQEAARSRSEADSESDSECRPAAEDHAAGRPGDVKISEQPQAPPAAAKSGAAAAGDPGGGAPAREDSRFPDLDAAIAAAEAELAVTREEAHVGVDQGGSLPAEKAKQDSAGSPALAGEAQAAVAGGAAGSANGPRSRPGGDEPADGDFDADEELVDAPAPLPPHDGEVLHKKEAEKIRIPVKEMGD